MIADIETAIWDRAIDPAWGDWAPPVADAILKIGFKQADIDRMNELAELARQGVLTPEQRAESEAYNRIGHLLAMLQSRARRARRQAAGA